MAKRQSSQQASDQHETKEKVEALVETASSSAAEGAAPATRAGPGDKARHLKRILQRGKRDKAARQEEEPAARGTASPTTVPIPAAETAAVESGEVVETLDQPPETREDAKHRTSAVAASLSQGGVLEQEPGPSHRKAPPIQLEEIEQATSDVDALLRPVVARFQQLLDQLVGRRGKSAEANKQIAAAVYDLARYSGIDLLCHDHLSNIRWHGGVFEARTTDARRNTLQQSADFRP